MNYQNMIESKTWRRIVSAFVIIAMFATIFVMPMFSDSGYANAAGKVKISKTKATIVVGSTLQLKVQNNKKKIKWATSNKKVATVSKKGKVKAKKKGKATITAKIGKKSYKCKVTVNNPPIINLSKATIDFGKTIQLSIKNTSAKVKWSSSNSAIAKVDSKGKVTAVEKGTATITATVEKKKFKCVITVTKSPLINPTGLSVIEKLRKVPYIVDIEGVTEATDPNDLLNKAGGYTSSTYFTTTLFDPSTVSGLTPADKGTEGGGCVEVFKTVAEANARNSNLAIFDGTFLSSGSHAVYGTIVIRTSDLLTASQQQLLEKAIYAELNK